MRLPLFRNPAEAAMVASGPIRLHHDNMLCRIVLPLVSLIFAGLMIGWAYLGNAENKNFGFFFQGIVWMLPIVGLTASILAFLPPKPYLSGIIQLATAYLMTVGFLFFVQADFSYGTATLGAAISDPVMLSFRPGILLLGLIVLLLAPILGYVYSIITLISGLILCNSSLLLGPMSPEFVQPYRNIGIESFFALLCAIASNVLWRHTVWRNDKGSSIGYLDSKNGLYIDYRDLAEDEKRLIFAVNAGGEIIYINPFGREKLRYDRAESEQSAIIETISSAIGESYADVLESLRAGNKWSGELLLTTTAIGEIIEKIEMKPVFTTHGYFTGAIASGDLSKEPYKQAQAIRQAFFDELTLLPNRDFIIDRLRDEIDIAARQNWMTSVVVLGINHFKDINDNYSREIGDATLISVSERLRGYCRPIDTVARLGGDEYGIIIPAMLSRDEVRETVDRILRLFSEPFHIDKNQIIVMPSLGVSLFSIYADDADKKIEAPEILLREADIAMKEAKISHSNSFSFFSQEMNNRSSQRFDIVTRARTAFAQNQFSLVYQPIIDLNNPYRIGVEVLLRWKDKDGQMISPELFIPILEQAGMIQTIGRWVLEKSCQQTAQWCQKNLPVSFISVNVSSFQINEKNFVDIVRNACESCDLSFQKLHIEVTEGAVLKQRRSSRRTLDQLRSCGVIVCMDDFGKGYSSLEYLKQFPFDILKIDRAFVAGIPHDEANVTVVKWAVKMAEVFDMKVVAEGIEHQSEVDFLRQINCDMVQGYFFGRPQKPADIEILLNKLNDQHDQNPDTVFAFIAANAAQDQPQLSTH